VLVENTGMLALAAEPGFTNQWDEGDSDLRQVTLRLNSAAPLAACAKAG
jgi:hypothetical protein